MSSAIQVHDLRKTFGRTVALDGLDLEVSTGEIHGFLGPNGAGKSTTIRILLGLLRSDGGTATLLGGDPWREVESLHRRLAYVPGDVALWPNLTGGEVIDLLGKLRGGLNEQRRAELLERFSLDPTKKGRSYSKGNRQKVALVAALSSDVELLILDEPTSGLDPLMEAVFKEAARERRQQGTTILLSSHILSEVESLCDRVSIIREGRNVESGTLEQLRHLSRTTVDATLERPLTAEQLHTVPGLADVSVTDHRVVCAVETQHLGDLLALLGRHGIRTLTSAPPTLEELFMDQYRTNPVAAQNGSTSSGSTAEAATTR
ncbi:ABC transporter ATP-binding protein [Terrabacter terrigena]|uniref:ATP-binding cassette domain-containing protein n=1 Tax=Terrabacter terrigena TaxID=574718 RepID=A0ABW3MUT9_9MICO